MSKPIEIRCPRCKERIGVMSIKRIRKMVIYLLKHIESLSQLEREDLEAQIEQMEKEDIDTCDECKREVPADAKFCCYCGCPFEEGVDASKTA